MKSTSRCALLAAAALAVCAGSGAWAQPDRALEQRFDAAIDPAEMGGWMKTMTAQPIHVGSPGTKANAELTLAQFKAWGWDAKIETYWVLYPTPKEALLEMVGGPGAPFRATLTEAPVPGDATSARQEGVLPAYVATSQPHWFT